MVERIRLTGKVIGITGAFAAALLLFPVLHECGHLFAAWVTGGGVSGFGLLPFYVKLRAQGSTERLLFVGVCGGWFPLLILLLPDRGGFYRYALKLAVATAGLFSAAESMICGVMLLCGGFVNAFDDAVILLRMFPDQAEIVFLALAIQTAVSAGFLCRTHPMRRVMRFAENA